MRVAAAVLFLPPDRFDDPLLVFAAPTRRHRRAREDDGLRRTGDGALDLVHVVRAAERDSKCVEILHDTVATRSLRLSSLKIGVPLGDDCGVGDQTAVRPTIARFSAPARSLPSTQ